MKNFLIIVGGLLLAATLSSTAFAAGKGKGGGPGGPGGGESQAGGLPGLEDRVEADEGLIATLQGQVATLQGQVATLESQSNWAVVDGATGAVQRSHSSAGAVTGSRASAGLYDVTFARDVSGCAYVATLGDTGTAAPLVGFINVSGDSGDVDSVVVQTFDKTGLVPTDGSFHLSVSCP
ncbi:MAG TPA: hypothetical protein VEU51_08425 [Candidatus Acidoferrales bacterium]|nr:hypothetical protein [Candidatus Acidoferrales bacterium]